MLIACSKCKAQLNVPDGSQGKQTTCPTCGETFAIEAPAAPAGGAAAGKSVPAARPLAVGVPGLNFTFCGLNLLRMAALFGTLLCLISFFMPWWSMSVDIRFPAGGVAGDDLRQMRGEIDPFNSALEKAVKFCADDASDKDTKELQKVLADARNEKSGDFSYSLWSWSFARGILVFIFSWPTLALIVVPGLVGALARWRWAFAFGAAAFLLTMWILALTVLAGTPGENYDGKYLSIAQGVSVGTVFAFIGSLLGLLAIAADAVLDLLAWLGSPRASAA